MFLDPPQDIIRSAARFRLHAHILRMQTVTWTDNTSPTCATSDLCNGNDVEDEQHVRLHCTYPHITPAVVSFITFAGFIMMRLCFIPKVSTNVSAFLSQNNNKLYFFLHAVIAFYEQASIRNS